MFESGTKENGMDIMRFSDLATVRVLSTPFHYHFVSLDADPRGLGSLCLGNPTELSQ